MIGPLCMGGARFLVFDSYIPAGTLILLDLGPWHQYRTLTNAAEAVVSGLYSYGLLKSSPRLLYIASDGERTEMCYQLDEFQGFKNDWPLELFSPQGPPDFKDLPVYPPPDNSNGVR